jgi:hypothetical protein
MTITRGRVAGIGGGTSDYQCKAKVMDTIAGEERVRFVISGFEDSDYDDFIAGDLTIEFIKDAFT